MGSIISRDARCVDEIKTRIPIAKSAFNKVKHLVTNSSISVRLRKRFIKSYVWSTMLYGCEAWTINKDMMKKIEAAEMWFFRKMLRLSWTEIVINAEVLHWTGTKRQIIKMTRQIHVVRLQ